MAEKFCTKCGKPIEDDMQFCPSCGTVVAGSAADAQQKEMVKEYTEAMKQNASMWLVFFLAIYAIPVIIASIVMLIDVPSTANLIINTPDFIEWMKARGIVITAADIEGYLYGIGACALVSGLCALGSAVLCHKKRKWAIAAALCGIAAVLCTWSVFGLFIGILVTWMIVSSKDLFED